MLVYQNSIYSVRFLAPTKTIQFNWEAAHQDMSYEDFQEACSNFVGYGFEYQAKTILIDVTNFKFQLPADFPEWQKNEHYPRYYKLGIQKVAYVMPEQYVTNAREIKKETGKFELRNFSTVDNAINFLT